MSSNLARAGRALLSRDPTTGLWTFAAWSLLQSISLLLPGQVFLVSPVYLSLRAIGIPEEVYGVFMALDAAALVWSTMSSGRGWRVVIAVCSGAFWLFFGAELLIGAEMAGFFAAVGGFCVIGAVGCLVAMSQGVAAS